MATQQADQTQADAGTAPPAGVVGVRARAAWLWRYWRGHRSNLVFLGFFTIVSTGVAVAYPLVFRWVIDKLWSLDKTTAPLGLDQRHALLLRVLLVLGVIMLGRFIAGFYPAARARMNLKLEIGVREDVFGELMKKDYRFSTRHRTGDVVTRLTDDVAEFPKIAWFGCSGIFRAVESGSKMVFCLAVMAALNWKLMLLAVVPLPVMMLVFYSLRHRLRDYMRTSQQIISRTNDLLESAFSGIRIVKAFRAEEGQRARLARLMAERVQVFTGLVRLQTLVQSLDTVASRVGQMIVLAIGGYMVIRGETTIGTVYAFYVYLDMLTHPMMDIPFLFMAGQQAFVSIDRVEEVRAFPVTPRRAGHDPLRGIEDIAFAGVGFGYDETRAILTDVTFRVPAGSKVAIVGTVACGKSTLVKLIAGILEPQAGEILVNGRPREVWDPEDYRRRMGYVPQEGTLFSHSIGENVIFGRPVPGEQRDGAPIGDAPLAAGAAGAAHGATQGAAQGGTLSDAEKAWALECLSIAQMDEDLRLMPEGLGTIVGQKGGLVSGGQRQRIAIARALAGAPEVLLLDDCTAALDARNEDRFWARLDEEFAGRTCFIVSHRPSTIRRADTILVLEGGRLIDQGTHEALAERCETYREFLEIERAKAHLGMMVGA
jgi:ATP-binding cassette subfamily B protein